jgi:hypothetical protein
MDDFLSFLIGIPIIIITVGFLLYFVSWVFWFFKMFLPWPTF